MHKEQRKIYLELTDLVQRGLCNCCRYAEWDGFHCMEMDLTCVHPLTERLGFPAPEDVWQGADCWGFRPKDTPSCVAKWVGVLLEGNMIGYEEDGTMVAVIPNETDRKLGYVG